MKIYVAVEFEIDIPDNLSAGTDIHNYIGQTFMPIIPGELKHNYDFVWDYKTGVLYGENY